MRIFLSHAGSDAAVARYLNTCFERVLGIDVFMMPDDAPAGSEWMDVMRRGLQTCDELVSLASPESVARPWLSAEWACFWLQNKPCTPLLVGARLDQLWEPMRAYQAVDLLNPSLSFPFLKRLAALTGVQPAEGALPLAHEIAEEIPAIRHRQRLASLEQVVGRVAERMKSGKENVSPYDVTLMVEAQRMPELLRIVGSPEAQPVKQRQVAVVLVSLRRLGDALSIALRIHNRAESRNVALAVVRSMHRGLAVESEEWTFLFGLYDYLRAPQRRDVRDELIKLGIAPLGVWADDPFA